MHSTHRRLLAVAGALGAALLPFACRAAERAPALPAWTPVPYPAARRVEQVDTYHGVAVADPYRWLEDPDAPETRAWIEAENALTQSYLAPVTARARIERRMTELWNFERFGMPVKRGSRYFLTRNDGLQNQAVLYSLDGLEGERRELLDPNKLSSDGTVALAGTVFSDDGRWLAYGTAEAGSDWNRWKVRDTTSAVDLADELRWIKFSSVSWSADNAGFFYSRYDAPAAGAELQAVNYYQKVFYHKVGTPQEQDELVYKRDDHKEWGFGSLVTEDGRWLVLSVSEGTDPRNRVFVDDLAQPGWNVIELIGEFDAAFDLVESDGDVLWFVTDLDAPRGKLIAIDVRAPQRSAWKTLIAQSGDKLESVSQVGGRFFCRYLHDAHSLVSVHALDGRREREVQLPGLGTARGFGGRKSDTETFYSFTSYTNPGSIRRYDVASGASELFRAPTLAFDPADFVTEQVFCTSKDGTRVPLFISHKQGARRSGANPTLLYAYGGFNISLTPTFSVARLTWMDMGGVFAVANLRGGGEYGEEWHKAGTKLVKQNVFDDFIAAAEYLVEQRWTRSDKLAINGGSNGGLLIGAVLNQRPELFGAALPAVGVMDMLRFESFTIGWAWASDYGSVKNADEFAALRAYSPYHNVVAGAHYPPTLVTTADHDDRVVPAHSFKYAAALQHAQGGDAPILIRIETRAGHGAGKPTTKQIAQAADELAFLTRALNLE